MLSENSAYLNRRRRYDETNHTGADTGRGMAGNPAIVRAFDIEQIEEEPSQREEAPPLPESETITDESFMMYQRFVFKISNWRAVSLIMSVFEASFLTLVAFIILYLRGNHVSLGISAPPPTFIIFCSTTFYVILKLCWLYFLHLRARRELTVSIAWRIV
jgi:hypothetical protein